MSLNIGAKEIKLDTISRNIKIKKLHKDAVIPTRGSDYAAGYDLYVCLKDGEDEIVIPAHCTRKVGTGLAMELPHNYFGAIFPRSGTATKKGIRMANCTAVIDEDYRGEWILPLHNDTDVPVFIKNGERVAQMILLPYEVINFTEVDELTETERGAGGFGSTGEK